MLSIVNESSGVPFNIRIVQKGECYGRDNCLIFGDDYDFGRERADAGDFLVEFYDARYAHTEWGQFTSRYYGSTLREHGAYELTLHGGVSDWWVTSQNVKDVLSYMDSTVTV